MSDIPHDVLLALTPGEYLKAGYLDAAGRPRPDLLSGDAIAAATQLRRAEVSPQEIAFTYEAIRALLPLHEGAADERFEAALGEALASVMRMIRQPNNEGLALWCRSCASFIREDADIAAFLAHMQAVLRLHALIAAMPPPGEMLWEDSSPSPSSGQPA